MSIKCQSKQKDIDLSEPVQYVVLANDLYSQWQLISILSIREKYSQAAPVNWCAIQMLTLQISFLITVLKLSLSLHQKRLLAQFCAKAEQEFHKKK